MTAPFTSKADFYEGSPIWEAPDPPDPPDTPTPTITTLLPTVMTAQNQVCTITGTGFLPDSKVVWVKSGSGNGVWPCTVVSDTEITFAFPIPPPATGAWSIMIQNPDDDYSNSMNITASY